MNKKFLENQVVKLECNRWSKGCIPPQTYEAGFGIGYNLGELHAYRTMLSLVNAEKAEESANSLQQLKAEISALVSKFNPDHEEHYTYHLKDLLRDLRKLSAV